MERSERTLFHVHGAIGGAVAGAVVAAWLLGVDIALGEPFYTAGRLSAAVLGHEFNVPWPSYVLLFTQLHFGVFILLGLAAVWFMKSVDAAPGLIPGLVFGIGVLNVSHYAGLMVTGTNLLTIVPVVHVSIANLLGGLLMMGYLRRVSRVESVFGEKLIKWIPTLYEGLLTGLCGAIAVAFWFFFLDLQAGAPFRTPATLGSALLLGAANPGEVDVRISVILAYSFLHLVVFCVVGITFAWFANRLQSRSGFWMPTIRVLVLLEVLFLGTVYLRSPWLTEIFGWGVILVGNLLAVGAMGLWIWMKHPKLRKADLG
jgi:hypothetical protein